MLSAAIGCWSGRTRLGRALVSILCLVSCASCESEDPNSYGPITRGTGGTGGSVPEPTCDAEHDEDGDGACPTLGEALDCDDWNPLRRSGIADVCNGRDDDCDDEIDEDGAPACALSCDAPAGGCAQPVDIAASGTHVCVLTADGSVLCWGSNRTGGLGTPEIPFSTRPIRVPGVSGGRSISTNAQGMTCVLRDADAVCWGGITSVPLVVEVPPDTQQIALRYEEICALSLGVVWCKHPLSDAYVQHSTGVLDMSANESTLCVLGTGGDLVCDGAVVGPAGNGFSMVRVGLDGSFCAKADELTCWPSMDEAPSVITGNAAATEFGTSAGFGCALGGGRVACWKGATPTSVDNAAKLAVGTDFACVLRQSGRVSCWGRRNNGALGDGVINGTSTAEPQDVKPAPTLALPEVLYQPTSPRGSCDNLHDLTRLLDGSGLIHSAVATCTADCENRLDTGECFTTCLSTLDMSAACLNCFATFSACEGPGCYEALKACAGLAPDFLKPMGVVPELECNATGCNTGAPLGSACSSSSECMSGNCEAHPFAKSPGETLCMARSGAYCSPNVAWCDCLSSQAYCGYCTGEGRAASMGYSFDPGRCYRSCSSGCEDVTCTSLCPFGGECQPFSDGSGYCG